MLSTLPDSLFVLGVLMFWLATFASVCAFVADHVIDPILNWWKEGRK